MNNSLILKAVQLKKEKNLLDSLTPNTQLAAPLVH
jgi:hypothetical protein